MELIMKTSHQPLLFLDFDEGLDELLETRKLMKLRHDLTAAIKGSQKQGVRKNAGSQLRGDRHE